LAAKGYWPARAARLLDEGKYSRAVELCRANLEYSPELLSARLIFGRALYHAGQTTSAAKQFHRVIAHDPDNVAALFYLANIRFGEGDEIGALEYFGRVLEIDPECRGLACRLTERVRQTTRTITLARPKVASAAETSPPLRRVAFVTETIGDLYLEQGHARLAAEVYRVLNQDSRNPRLADKLARAEAVLKDKDH